MWTEGQITYRIFQALSEACEICNPVSTVKELFEYFKMEINALD